MIGKSTFLLGLLISSASALNAMDGVLTDPPVVAINYSKEGQNLAKLLLEQAYGTIVFNSLFIATLLNDLKDAQSTPLPQEKALAALREFGQGMSAELASDGIKDATVQLQVLDDRITALRQLARARHQNVQADTLENDLFEVNDAATRLQALQGRITALTKLAQACKSAQTANALETALLLALLEVSKNNVEIILPSL